MNPWFELLEAAREHHAAHPCRRGCRLCVALEAFPVVPSLFDVPVPEPPVVEFDAGAVDRDKVGGFRRSDPVTSKAAAVAVFPSSGTQRMRVYEVVAAAGDVGATVADVMAATGLPHQSASTRLSELKRGGWVAPNGKERLGGQGRMQAVMVATESARAAWAGRAA